MSAWESAAPAAASQSVRVRVHAGASVRIVHTVRTMACAGVGMGFDTVSEMLLRTARTVSFISA